MNKSEIKTLWKLARNFYLAGFVLWIIETAIFLIYEGWHLKATHPIEIYCDDVFEKQLAVKQLGLCKSEVKDYVLVIKLKDSTIAKLDTINAKTTKELTKTETALSDCQNKPKEKKNRGLWLLIGAVLGGLANSFIK